MTWLIAALLLSSFLVTAPPAQAQAQSAEEAIQTVLDTRMAALARDDLDGWMGTVDPRASEDFRTLQKRQFEGLQSLPVTNFRLSASFEETGDLASPGLAERYGDAVMIPETRQTLRFDGYDDRDSVEAMWLTYVQRDGQWFVASDTDLAAVGLDTARGLWDLGGVEMLETDHFLVLSHPDRASRARELAAIAEEAAELLRDRWSDPWLGRIPMILPSSIDELEVLLQSTIDLDKFVAFVSYGVVQDDDYVYTAPRIYIQDHNLSRYGRSFQIETLVHELNHAAAVPLAGPAVPAWIHEGVADWVATGRRTREQAPAGSDGVLPRDYEFVTGSQASIVRSYNESRAAISFLARRHGLDAPAAVLKAVGAAKVAPGNADYHVDVALRQVGAGGLADFDRAWAG